MRIVVLGRHGQLGCELQRELSRFGLVIPVGRESADLEEPKQLRRYLRNMSPDMIVNAAAYTDVDRAENEPRRAKVVNGIAPGIIAEEALRAQAVLVHFSTDYVFDGNKRVPYLERDDTSPLNTYGETKLLGEEAIQEVGGAYLILRTSWIFSDRGENFVRKILRRAQEKKEFTVVNDQVGVPTSAAALAHATGNILERIKTDASRRGMRLYTMAKRVSGVYNAVCEGHGSWFDFAEAIVQFARGTELGRGLRLERLLPISSDEFPAKARRPAYSVLAREKLQSSFKIDLPHWKTCLEQSVFAITQG
jgi:dTDP-4-dehydrorhamnose reductase